MTSFVGPANPGARGLSMRRIGPTEYGAGEREVVVHELAEGDDHGGGGVLVKVLLEVDALRHQAGAGQRQTVVALARRVDAVVVRRSDQPKNGGKNRQFSIFMRQN